jgi:hypothetical protein
VHLLAVGQHHPPDHVAVAPCEHAPPRSARRRPGPRHIINPPMYLVTLCTTMSAPWSSGFCRGKTQAHEQAVDRRRESGTATPSNLEVGGEEGVVDDQQRPVPLGHRRHRRDVRHLHRTNKGPLRGSLALKSQVGC